MIGSPIKLDLLIDAGSLVPFKRVAPLACFYYRAQAYVRLDEFAPADAVGLHEGLFTRFNPNTRVTVLHGVRLTNREVQS